MPRTDTIRLKAGEVLAWAPKLAPLPSTPASRGGGPSGRAGDDGQCRQSMASASWTDARAACARAAQGGSVTAARDLATLFQRGNGTPRNDDSAAHWYQQAARGGDAESMYQLGSDFERGRGVRKDPGAALDWYTRAANAGHAEAQYMMGQLFERGRLGAVKDRDEAISWYRKAASQGQRDAASRLKALER